MPKENKKIVPFEKIARSNFFLSKFNLRKLFAIDRFHYMIIYIIMVMLIKFTQTIHMCLVF